MGEWLPHLGPLHKALPPTHHPSMPHPATNLERRWEYPFDFDIILEIFFYQILFF